MARHTGRIVSVSLLLASAARFTVDSRKLDTEVADRAGARAVLRDGVVCGVIDHMEAVEKLPALRAKRAKFAALAQSKAGDDLELVTERLAEIDAEIARYVSLELGGDHAELLTSARARCAGGTDWANAATALLALPTVDMSDHRAVGCLIRTVCQ